jgi:uncharacterized protein involved in outer membrane biogenesis
MPPRVRIIARSALLLAGVLLAALLVVAAIVRLSPIQRWVAARVSERLPPGVSVERVTITLLPPGVHLADVSLGSDGTVLHSVSCHLNLAALLAERVEISEMVVDGAAFNIERAADGSFTTGALAALLRAPSGGAGPANGRAPPALDALPPLRVTDASVTFTDQAAREGPRTLRVLGGQLAVGAAKAGAVPLSLSAQCAPAGRLTAQGSVRAVTAADGVPDYALDATVSATDLDAQTVFSYLAAAVPGGGSARAVGALNGSLKLSGSRAAGLTGDVDLTQPSGSLTWDEATFTTPIELSAHLATSPDGIALSDGHLTIAQLTVARIGATDLNAAFAASGRVLHLTSLRATAYGGTWTQSGTVELTEPPNFDLTLRADGVSCDALLTAITGVHPDYGCEQFSADAALHGEWTGAKSVAHSAQGNGHVEMRGGSIPSSSIIAVVWDALVPLIKIGSAARALGAPTRVDRLTESFALQAGRMHTSDLSVVTDDYTITGRGSIGLDATLDLNTKIAMTPAGVTKMLTMAALPIPGDPGELPSIPTRITGSIGHPIIRPEVSDVPSTAVLSVVRGARGAADALQDAAGEGLRGLKWGVHKIW